MEANIAIVIAVISLPLLAACVIRRIIKDYRNKH